MSTKITNQATLNFTSGDDKLAVTSNTASVTLHGPLEIQKQALESNYRLNDTVTYTVIIKNTGTAPLDDIEIVDNLGTYTLTGTTTTATPLTYVGPTAHYIDDDYNGNLTPTIAAKSITFAISRLAAGKSLLLHYKVKTNGYAPVATGSEITNIIAVSADGIEDPVIDSFTIPIASYADVTIDKSMSPDPVVSGSLLTYRFLIRNYGTSEATSVTLTDSFTTIPNIINVVIDGVETDQYSLIGKLFTYPSTASAASYSIPAASFIQDSETGLITATPGVSTIIIQGNVS